MPAIPFHILVEGNPALIYASRNGSPDKVLRILSPFLETFWQERQLSGETADTPEVLVAQLVVRFGFEFSEDDFSNLKVGIAFDPRAEYLYVVQENQMVQVYHTTDTYRSDPSSGVGSCQLQESCPI